jgi:hypothetical protein
MKSFKTLIVVKYPKQQVWEALRDTLAELAAFLDDVSSIKQLDRKQVASGQVMLTNLWTANIEIPQAIRSMLHAREVSWVDRAEWTESKGRCEWQIEPQFFTEHIKCAGTTSFDAAIGGRGTRITFEGTIEITLTSLPGVPNFMLGTATKAIESLVTTLIPKNFQKMTGALSHLLEQNTQPPVKRDRK